MTEAFKLISPNQYEALDPKQQGYLTYFQAMHPGSEIPKSNPYEAGSDKHKRFAEGEFAAMLEQARMVNGLLTQRAERAEKELKQSREIATKYEDRYFDACAEWEAWKKRAERAEAERDEAVSKMQQGWLEVTESGINHYKQVAERAKADFAELLGTSQWQQIEIADLRDDVKRLHTEKMEQYEARIKAEAERDAALKDAERLNYLIANECQVWECNGRYAVHDVTEHHPITAEHDSARAAIDAAIAARKGEQ